MSMVEVALETKPRAVTWRSVALGSLSVMLVCSLSPFNDFVVANTVLTGSYLPLVVVVWFFALTVLVNAPLHRWAPRHALSAGELAVVMAMMLVSCAIPSTGLMRFLMPTMVTPFYFGGINQSFWNAFLALDLPTWLFPVEVIEEGRSSPIVRDFYNRSQDGSVPYGAWVIPLVAWGVFVAAMFTALMALAALVRYQWAVNERLAFPLAQVELSLIEAPRPGRMLNDLLGSRIFWMGLTAVFLLHSITALQQYFPRTVPAIPLRYNLGTVLSNEPWVYLHYSVKSATIFFTFIGIAYFIQSRVSFSLWAFFLLAQVASVQQRMVQSEITGGAWRDQHLGAGVMMVLGILWIGRQQWLRIARQMFGIVRPGESTGDLVSYRLAAWLLVVSLFVMLAWFMFMGVQMWVGALIIFFILLAHVVTSRIVAETGLPFVRMDASITQIQANLPPSALTGQDVYFSGAFTANGVLSSREGVMGLGLHAMQVVARTPSAQACYRRIVALLTWALLLGFVVSAATSLWCYYNYATPLTPKIQKVLNDHALEVRPYGDMVDPLTRWNAGNAPHQSHNSWMHMGIGAGLTAALQVLTLRSSAWPLPPVGYLLCSSWYMQMAWFSLMLGWLLKVLILKYGGAKLYQQARPLFVGAIFGEALAAGAWLIVNLVLAAMGADYRPINLMPT